MKLIKMEEIKSLIQTHKFYRNHIRINIASPDDLIRYNNKPYLKKGVLSNSLRSGDLFDMVKKIYPNINEIVVNKNVLCKPHRDKTNVTESHIIFFGDFIGGALCFEDGTRFEEKERWFDFDGQKIHWNEPHENTKYSLIAYARKFPLIKCSAVSSEKEKSTVVNVIM